MKQHPMHESKIEELMPICQLQSLKLHNCHLSPAVGLGLGCTVDVRGGKLLLTERRCSIALQQFSVATAIEKR